MRSLRWVQAGFLAAMILPGCADQPTESSDGGTPGSGASIDGAASGASNSGAATGSTAGSLGTSGTGSGAGSGSGAAGSASSGASAGSGAASGAGAGTTAGLSGSTMDSGSPPDATASSGAAPDSGSGGCGVPKSFKWSSTGAIIAPKSDATHSLTAIKDPTVVFFKNQWNVYASTSDSNGNYNSVYLGFADWSAAGSAPQTYLNGGVAPQVFYFAPQNLWYRIYEWPDVYDTNTDPTQPQGWSPGKNFYSSVPSIVTQNQGSGGWIDFWVTCDDTNCFLFFSDDNGHLYRAQTSIGSFPNGFGQPVIAMSDPSPGRLFEASCVYSMKGTGQYLLLVEAYDSGSGGRRYYRSWTAPALDGTWTPLQAEYTTAFASGANVSFGSGTAWTKDISHGEMLRSGYDQKLEIDTCNLQFLYQGKDPNASGSYNTLPWRLGLLTKTN